MSRARHQRRDRRRTGGVSGGRASRNHGSMTVRELTALFRLPVVVAPMAGGPSNPALVATAAQAGAIGFLAGGYKAASAVVAEIAEVRAGTAGALGGNLSV